MDDVATYIMNMMYVVMFMMYVVHIIMYIYTYTNIYSRPQAGDRGG